jgi:uncharacterized protein (DUF486 family)
MQEAITFVVFAQVALGESLRMKHAAAFGLIFAAVVVAFR